MKEAAIFCKKGELDWKQFPILDIKEGLSGIHSKLAGSSEVTAFAQIAYDSTALYLHLSASEPEIRAEEEGLLAMPCNDSCLEFFFCPQEGDSRYFNFEFTPKATLYLGFGSCMETLTRLVIEEEFGGYQALFKPQVTQKADSWEISYEIPFTFIRRFFPNFTAASGKTVRANFYKCADLASKPHYLTWNPITREGEYLFHTPEEFGLLRFA